NGRARELASSHAPSFTVTCPSPGLAPRSDLNLPCHGRAHHRHWGSGWGHVVDRRDGEFIPGPGRSEPAGVRVHAADDARTAPGRDLPPAAGGAPGRSRLRAAARDRPPLATSPPD